MTFSWHCRECNTTGEVTETLNQILHDLPDRDKVPVKLMDVLVAYVRKKVHFCKGDIGVKAS